MRAQFTEATWPDIVRLPAVVFWAVALADGKADSGERSCFLYYLRSPGHVDPLFCMVCDQLSEQGKAALELSAREQDYETYLREAKLVLERSLSVYERRNFLAALLCLGHHVASASGGFFGLGNRVAPVEAERIEKVGALLGLPELLEQA